MTEARISINEPTASPARLHQLHDQLMRDLRALPGVAVQRSRENAPQNSKSGIGAQIAELIVTGTLSGGTLAALTQVCTALINRSASRSVTIKLGDREVTVTGSSAKVQREIAELFAEDEKARRSSDG